MTPIPAPHVGVILVNWRGCRDTLLSLETLFGGGYTAFDVVIVDNASGDDSVERIKAWADGLENVYVPEELLGHVKVRADTRVIESNIFTESELKVHNEKKRVRLTIIRAQMNGGFATGNNIALDYLRSLGGYEYYWLLNNDAFPAPDALSFLIARATKDSSLGQIGATLVYADRPNIVQALGGAVFDPKTGRAYHIGAGCPLNEISKFPVADIERRMNYIVGASILVTSDFVACTGLMEESYFLYYEEIDWAERSKSKFKLGYVPEALVYHKAGGSTQKKSRRSAMAAYYLARNRIKFTKQYYPAFLTSVTIGVMIDALRYAVRAHWSEANGFFQALRESIGFTDMKKG
jgi:GT2 family glycosyltransferase